MLQVPAGLLAKECQAMACRFGRYLAWYEPQIHERL